MTRYFGLTGGIGSGKSVCSRYLASRGAMIVDADALTAEAYVYGRAALERTFGKEIFDETGRVDRKALGGIVFGDEGALRSLNAILHPIMSELAHDKLVSARGLAVLDAALLFEAGWDELVEASVVVLAPLETRIERIMVRDGMTRESALSRIAAQLCDAERLKRADHIIYNMGDLNMIHAQCERIFL